MKTLEQLQRLASEAKVKADEVSNKHSVAYDKKESKKRTEYWKWIKDIIEYVEMNPTVYFLKKTRKKNMDIIHGLHDRAKDFYAGVQYDHIRKKKISKFMAENGANKLKKQVKNIDFILQDI